MAVNACGATGRVIAAATPPRTAETTATIAPACTAVRLVMPRETTRPRTAARVFRTTTGSRPKIFMRVPDLGGLGGDGEAVLVAEPLEAGLAGDAVGVAAGVAEALLPGRVGGDGGGAEVAVGVALGEESGVDERGCHGLYAAVVAGGALRGRVAVGCFVELGQVHDRLLRFRCGLGRAGQLEGLAGGEAVGVLQSVEGGDLPVAGAGPEGVLGDGPQGVALAYRVRAARAGGRCRGRCGLVACQPVVDAFPHRRHGEPARVDLAGLPLEVPDHRAFVPAVVARDGGGCLLDREQLLRRPRVLAVAEVLAFEAVEVPVAVGVGLVVGGQVPLGDVGAEDVVVAEARVVGATVADEVDVALLADHAVAEGSGQAGVAAAADVDRVVVAAGDGVVDHHAVHRAPRTLAVAVVVAPVAFLDDREAFRSQGGEESVGGHGWRHEGLQTCGSPGPGLARGVRGVR